MGAVQVWSGLRRRGGDVPLSWLTVNASLVIAGYQVGDIAERATSEEITAAVARRIAVGRRNRRVSRGVSRGIPGDRRVACDAHGRADAMDALRMAAGTPAGVGRRD
jgi:hypothetical protein